jgi:hypothetical protein
MRSREFITLLGGAAVLPLAARAQGLSETGYVVGQNVAFEHRAAGSDYDRFRDMADERAGRADEPYSQRGDRSALPLRQPPPASPTHPNILPYERNAAISWHFERDPIPYALETDWLAEAGGFEPLHFRNGIRQDSQPRWRDSNLCIWESDPLHSLSHKARI